MLTGWLFDVYPQGRGVTLWLLDRQGQAHQLRDRFTPSFYVQGPSGELRQVWQELRRRWPRIELARAERRELYSDEDIDVLQAGVPVPAQFQRAFRHISEFKPDLTYYNADIPLPQRYVLAREVFPLAYCAVEHQDGEVQHIEALNSPWEVEYELPPLRVMTLRLDGELRSPRRGHRGDLLVTVDGETYQFPRRRSRQLVLGVQHLLERHDPDLLVSAYGDSYLLPRLIELAEHYGLRLPLNRDSRERVQRKRGHSYFSYGKVIFRDEQHTLFGRWHIDRQNAFLVDDYGLDGIIEIARLSGLAVQHVARASSGTSISAMQVATALRRGVLVPWQKRHPEALKSGREFMVADKGGLVYNPIAGLHQHVAELDFTAMYPSLMVHFNLSPETVKTDCCQGKPVPELGTPVCQHRRGLVPETLAPLLAKRARYKELAKSLPSDDPRAKVYRRRYSAHKWLLVTCFGYLGYKNARFGRIEAHEAVTAYGREVLLQAKELVEAEGFRVLHLYVDGLWIHKPGAGDRPDYESLLERISQKVGIPIELEGIYRWLAFLPSRTEPRVAAANRYFGAFEDGSLKMRGIETRRHDTPAYIEQTQLGMLEILAEAEDAAAFRRTVPSAIDYATDRLRQIQRGEVASRELVISRKMSRKPEDFRVRTAVARAAIQLAKSGVDLEPGERIRYLHVPGPAVVRAWDLVEEAIAYDRETYVDLLLRAVETVLMPLGVGRPTIETWLLGGAGYWGPPGVLPPAGADIGAPLLAQSRRPGVAVVGRKARARRQRYQELQLPAPVPQAKAA